MTSNNLLLTWFRGLIAEWKTRNKSPVLHKECKHLVFDRLPRELIMCRRCHRTFRFSYGPFGADEIHLNERELNKLLEIKSGWGYTE